MAPKARQTAASKSTAQGKDVAAAAGSEDDDDKGLKIGKFRLHLDRIPEFLLLMLFAGLVAYICADAFEMTRQTAVPTGLFVAVQVQKLINWLRDWVGYKT
eukprot:gb/GFBE01056623.1/.p1 GENE.gb/GFBE01056623.1/~~gb/GFBE01056623.1/.p1  ORF type:complete len:101 (+),score=25.68 gb/GFBE01056623.1/:1-303(+)